MVRNDDERILCTIAGLVLFGRVLRRALPQAGVRWMAFRGDDKQYSALYDSLLDGPIAPLTNADGAIVEFGLVERCLERMRPFISAEQEALSEGARRIRHFDYPEEAVREALLNAKPTEIGPDHSRLKWWPTPIGLKSRVLVLFKTQ